MRIFFQKYSYYFMPFAVLLIGLAVTIDWLFDIQAISQLQPHLAPMQLNAAICFIFLGSSLIAYHTRSYRFSLLLLFIPLIISTLTGLQYLFNYDFGIDKLLIDPSITTMTSHPGRMAPNTVLCMLFSSMGILCLSFSSIRNRPCLISNEMGTLTASFGLISLIGFVIGNEAIHRWGNLTGMAIQAAVAFLILGSAIVFASYRKDCVECQFDEIPKYHSSITIVLGAVFFNLYLVVRAEEEFYKINTKANLLVLVYGVIIVLIFHFLLKSRYQLVNQSDRLTFEKELILRTKKRIELSQKIDQKLIFHTNPNYVINEIIQLVCRSLDFKMGLFWRLANETLNLETYWLDENKISSYFIEMSRQLKFEKGIGLLGIVWMKGLPQWISDIENDPDITRKMIAYDEHLRGAFAFPLIYEGSVIGIIEFYSLRRVDVDQELLDEFFGIGVRLGQFITRLKTEQELATSKKSFEQLSLALASSAIVSMTDEKGIITMANEKFAQISGYSIPELIGHDHRMLNSGFHSKQFFTNMWDTLLSGNIWAGEVRNKRKDGLFYWVYATVIPLKNDENKIENFISIRFDITAAKNAESQLIYNSKLAALGEMSAGLAHEINNPLSVINGQVDIFKIQLLSNQLDQEKLGKGFERIGKMVKRISTIVSGLKLFSRSDNNADFKNNSIKTILEISKELCEERFRNHDIHLEINCLEDYEVLCNSTQISQVFINLLNNSFDAIQSLPDRWIKINVSKVGTKLICSFTDSGSGIPEEILPKVMSPFFTTKEPGKGTGLGLSISKGIIEKHGGDFYYDKNSPNTTFVVVFS